jgi:RNA 2',3'-cyclic 3'-phosphodiesterase
MFRPNWFIAFPIDGAFVLELPTLPPNFRRFHPEDVHLTLAFLGAVGEDGAARAMAALDRCLRDTPREPLTISLAEVVPMGGARLYTALSALVGEGRPVAERYLGELRDPLTEAANGRHDRRPPKPHVTVARPVRRATDSDRAAGLSWAQSITPNRAQYTLDRIALYTWSETRRERMFRIVDERHLTQPLSAT